MDVVGGLVHRDIDVAGGAVDAVVERARRPVDRLRGNGVGKDPDVTKGPVDRPDDVGRGVGDAVVERRCLGLVVNGIVQGVEGGVDGGRYRLVLVAQAAVKSAAHNDKQ